MSRSLEEEEALRTNDPKDPINQLYGEHDHALEQLQILGGTGHAMAKDGVSPDLLRGFKSAVAFLDHEVREHNEWEENHLFPLLELYTGPGGPCAVMRAEHRTLWDTYGAMGPVLLKVESGTRDPATLDHLAFLADSIVELLSSHIGKENEILFPMARRMLGPEDIAKLAAARPAA